MIEQETSGHHAAGHRPQDDLLTGFHRPWHLQGLLVDSMQCRPRLLNIFLEQVKGSLDVIRVSPFQTVSLQVVNVLSERARIPIINGCDMLASSPIVQDMEEGLY